MMNALRIEQPEAGLLTDPGCLQLVFVHMHVSCHFSWSGPVESVGLATTTAYRSEGVRAY